MRASSTGMLLSSFILLRRRHAISQNTSHGSAQLLEKTGVYTLNSQGLDRFAFRVAPNIGHHEILVLYESTPARHGYETANRMLRSCAQGHTIPATIVQISAFVSSPFLCFWYHSVITGRDSCKTTVQRQHQCMNTVTTSHTSQPIFLPGT